MRDDKVQLLWSGEAESDLFVIWSQGAARWSEEKAAEHLLEIQKTVSRLFRNPMLGRSRDEVMVGIRSVLVEPHIVFYQVSNSAIEIVRVLHQHMDVESVF